MSQSNAAEGLAEKLATPDVYKLYRQVQSKTANCVKRLTLLIILKRLNMIDWLGDTYFIACVKGGDKDVVEQEL